MTIKWKLYLKKKKTEQRRERTERRRESVPGKGVELGEDCIFLEWKEVYRGWSSKKDRRK